jgi:hypothetical protein
MEPLRHERLAAIVACALAFALCAQGHLAGTDSPRLPPLNGQKYLTQEHQRDRHERGSKCNAG